MLCTIVHEMSTEPDHTMVGRATVLDYIATAMIRVVVRGNNISRLQQQIV